MNCQLALLHEFFWAEMTAELLKDSKKYFILFYILNSQSADLKLKSVQFFDHPWDSTAMWDLNLYSSMLSLMIIPRTVETKSEEIVFVLSEEEISHLLSHPSCLHR